MPRKIDNLEDKIIGTSLELFEKSSYENVNMRTIARETGIAVGTLYNYFPTKWDLYRSVFERSWEDTYKKLRTETQNTNRDCLTEFLGCLYFEMKKKHGVARELFRYISNELETEEKRKAFQEIKFPDVVVNQIYELFVANLRKALAVKVSPDNNEIRKLFTMVHTSIPLIFKVYQNKDEDNIEFLQKVVESFSEKNF